MPKIYDQKQESERGTGSSSFKEPGHERTQKRGMVIAIVVVLAIIIVMMLYRMARGAEITGVSMTISAPSTTAQTLTDYRALPEIRSASPAWLEGATYSG